MRVFIQILLGVVFILSSGLFFIERLRRSMFGLILAGVVAVLSSYFMFEQLAAYLVSPQATDVVRPPTHEPLKTWPVEIIAAFIGAVGSIVAAIVGGVVGAMLIARSTTDRQHREKD